jgi:hypothetical protein
MPAPSNDSKARARRESVPAQGFQDFRVQRGIARHDLFHSRHVHGRGADLADQLDQDTVIAAPDALCDLGHMALEAMVADFRMV